MSSISPKNRLNAIDVLLMPDDAALRWLKDNSYSDAPFLFSNPERELHKIVSFSFSRRRSKRVRLAVARYGSHIQTLNKLFKKGARSERLAVLSNSLIGPKNEGMLFSSDYVLSKADAKVVLQNYQSSPREFSVFVSNPHIDREWLTSIISGWKKIEDLDKDGLLFLVHSLADNTIINSRRDETLMDGWAEHSFNKLNFALADLLQTVPVTIGWADVLSRMLENLYLSFVPDFEVDLIERWKDPEPTDDGERFYFTYLREQITRHLIIHNHRSEVKEKYPIDHGDSAVRKGFYSSLQPYELFEEISWSRDFCYPLFQHLDNADLSESQQQFVDFCKKCFERDKNDFVESLILNENFWTTKEDRAFLRDIAWGLAEDPRSLMDVPNLYNARKQYHFEHNSSFFKDDELVGVSFEDTVDGKLSTLQEGVSKLQEKIKSQSLEELADQQRIYFESIIGDTQYQIRCLSDNVSEKNEELTRVFSQGPLAQQFHELKIRIRNQTGLIWLLIIVIIIIWYLNINN